MGKPLDKLEKYEEWMVLWSEYLANTLDFTVSSEKENMQEVIQNILLSNAQGNSCLSIDRATVERLRSLVAFGDKSHTCPFIYDGKRVYLYRYYALEQRLAKQVKRLTEQPSINLDISAYKDLLVDEYQQLALKMVAKHHLGIITGGPGTGKTYTLARIIAVLNKETPDLRIAMAAPTGKAAQRMQEALQSAFQDKLLNDKGLVTPALQMVQPVTLHRLLAMGNRGIAKFNLKQPLPFDVIVVDEASMLDLNLATALFEAVADGAKLILLGDANQLASVGVGSVLADLQQVEALQAYRTHLVHSRRFNDDAQIGKMAKFIQQVSTSTLFDHEQLLKRFNDEVVQVSHIEYVDLHTIVEDHLQIAYLPKKITEAELEKNLDQLCLGYTDYIKAVKAYNLVEGEDESDLSLLRQKVLDCFNDYRILTAMNVGVFGVNRVNQYVEQQFKQEVLGYSKREIDWYVGRPVMVMENDYQLGISNGDIGICFRHRQDHKQYEVFFPSLNKWVVATRLPQTIQTAFAMTIHKSQGSEFEHVAVVLEESSQRLLSRELLYTAITRAKRVVSLFVDPQSLTTALSVKTVRQSGLCSKIDSFVKAVDV
ncbi:exodeoxyribonuclease V, alpha subunit [Acinetobacter nectaris CIP 110549]|uniref:RecBCD enzyme subunit RecD n=1 Tax=Acinetobacter nectaris CIP 110549 TaxID=1392540 RepID=V2T8E9_9GAMM|nr:exodeoxyribonuclease V subunit alpha [Acinetobacter nectaris]ESK38718.1 exodeoxyribonuclease V, alpha subunit [Acinetobacter nectaris CIP 110549]